MTAKKRLIALITLFLVIAGGVGAYYLGPSESFLGYFRIMRKRSVPVAEEQQRQQQQQQQEEVAATSEYWWCIDNETWEKKWNEAHPGTPGAGPNLTLEPGSIFGLDPSSQPATFKDRDGNQYDISTRDDLIPKLTFIPQSPTTEPPDNTREDPDTPTVTRVPGSRGGTIVPTPGETPTPGEVPNEDPKKIKYAYYECGCDDENITVEETGDVVDCPDYNSSTSFEKGDVIAFIWKVPKYECECKCEDGFQIDWLKLNTECDPAKIAIRKICYPESFDPSTEEKCACMKGDEINEYTSTLEQLGCFEKDDCEEYKTLFEAGELSPPPPGVTLNLNAIKEICSELGYETW